MTDTVMNFRVDQDLKNAFDMAARDMDLTSSQLLRHYMRKTVAEYMAANAQGSLIERKKPVGDAKAPTKAKKPAKSLIPASWRAK